MADITMCSTHDCIDKDKCYRYTAPVTQGWQAYFVASPRESNDVPCEMYWENSNEPHERSTA